MLRLTCTLVVVGAIGLMASGNTYAFDEDVAALVVDNGAGYCLAGFPGDTKDENCDDSSNAVTRSSSSLPKHYTQTLLSTDQCGDMTVNDFFSHKFKTLDFHGTGKLTCNQTGTNLARAFADADTNHDGLLTEAEFNAFIAEYAH